MITFQDIRKSYTFFARQQQTSDLKTIFNLMVKDFSAADQINVDDHYAVGRLFVRVSLYSLIAWLY